MATFTNTWDETTPLDNSLTALNEAGKVDDVIRQLMLDVEERILKYTPIGMVIKWPSDLIPDGFFECDGRSLSRTDHADLFSVLGTYHGAADASHFNIPDRRGYFSRGWDDGAGFDPEAAARTLPGITGETMTAGDHVGTLQDEEIGRAHV